MEKDSDIRLFPIDLLDRGALNMHEALTARLILLNYFFYSLECGATFRFVRHKPGTRDSESGCQKGEYNIFVF